MSRIEGVPAERAGLLVRIIYRLARREIRKHDGPARHADRGHPDPRPPAADCWSATACSRRRCASKPRVESACARSP